MREWIVGLRKAAVKAGEGICASEWGELESEAGQPVPDELKELYEAMNGASLRPDVKLYKLKGDSKTPGALEHSKGQKGVWVFGQRGSSQKLFAIRVKELRQKPKPPERASELSDGEWVWGIRKGDEARYFRSLEQLIERVVPPVETEDIGEVTYAQALSAVQGALEDLEALAADEKKKKSKKR